RHDTECGERAAALIAQAAVRERITAPLVLYQDNGSSMQASTFVAKLDPLGIHRSYSRPGVSDDNPYSESLFRTVKYRPHDPGAFAGIEEARTWMLGFVRRYNEEHQHRNLKFVSPAERHEGKDAAIFAHRMAVYEPARSRSPGRWSRNIRNGSLPTEVWLNRPAEDAGSATRREAA
ncbi:integrase catalytic subunit, partial [mine drainage metagenome]